MKLFDVPKIKLIKHSLNVYDKQHQAISKNIAHANDKNYQRVDTDLSIDLKFASDSNIKITNTKHIIPSGNQENFSSKKNKSEGAVDFIQEMGDLAVIKSNLNFPPECSEGSMKVSEQAFAEE